MQNLASLEPSPEEVEAALSDPDAFYEIVDGAIEEKPSLGAFALFVAKHLYDAMNAFNKDRPSGRVVHECKFVLDPARPLKRQPDVSFVSFERWPEGRPIPEMGDWEVVPDLAVEVLSTHDQDRKLGRKIRESFRHGVRQVWVVKPLSREVYIYTTARRIEVIDEEVGELDGGEMLPGFRVSLADLFRTTVGQGI